MDVSPLQAVVAPEAFAAAAQALAEATGISADDATAALGVMASALAQPPQGADGTSRLLAGEDLAQRLLGTAREDATHEPTGAPLAAADPAAETAVLQNLLRPPLSAVEASVQHQAGAEPEMSTADGASTGFALPDAQLVPALLIGLQVDPGVGWALPQPQPPVERSRTQEAPEEHEAHRQRGQQDAEAGAGTQEHDEGEQGDGDNPAPPPLVFDAADARLDGLLRSLHVALCVEQAPQALRAAAEQWQRGRGVVLAFPQSAAPQGAAWVYVLAPQATAGPAGALVRLAGPCFEAWLQWRTPPRGAHWSHARMVKEHHPRHGRRLVAADASQDGVCAVQLGPVLAPRRVPGAVTLRIAAARSFWDALGVQWSALVVVSSIALAGESRSAGMKESR